MVRSKFKCDSITLGSDVSSVSLVPVTSGCAENDAFYKYTPGGTINLGVLLADTANSFKPGKSYYVDFTEAD